MAEKVKITRKDLKGPDEFVSFTSQVYSWAQRHYRELSFLVIGALLVVAASVFIHNRSLSSNLDASIRINLSM